jgi:hypothetical protein
MALLPKQLTMRETLRSNNAPKSSKTTQLEKKIETTDEEIQRLRAAVRRVKPIPRTRTTGRD